MVLAAAFISELYFEDIEINVADQEKKLIVKE
jgi:hypothetical protein